MNPGWYGKNFQYCRGFLLVLHFFPLIGKVGVDVDFGKAYTNGGEK